MDLTSEVWRILRERPRFPLPMVVRAERRGRESRDIIRLFSFEGNASLKANRVKKRAELISRLPRLLEEVQRMTAALDDAEKAGKDIPVTVARSRDRVKSLINDVSPEDILEFN